MVCVILIIALSMFDAYISGYLIGARLAVELNPVYPEWLLTSMPIRGTLATLAALWYYSRGWNILLWLWCFILAGLALWNINQFIIAKIPLGG